MRGGDAARLRELGGLLRDRRVELGYRHVPAFTAARDINSRMVGDIEHARRDTYERPTLDDIAAAYAVTRDSMVAVVWSDAGELVPLSSGDPAPVPARPSLPSPPIDDAARTAADRPYADRIWADLRAWAAKGVTDPSGAQLFGPGTPDAQAWDGTRGRMDDGDRVWHIADLQRRDGDRRTNGRAVTGA